MKIGYLMQAGVPNVRQRPLSGPANHVKQVFNELRKLGHQVRLLAYLDGQIWLSDDLEAYKPVANLWLDRGLLHLFEKGIRRIQSEFYLPYVALFDSLRFVQACHQELADCDLFYERMGWMGYGGAVVSRWLNKPLVLEINGDHLAEMELQGIAPHGMQRQASMKLTRFAARHASHAVATGESWRRRYMEQWDITPEKVSVIENGSELVELLDRGQLRAFRHDNNRSQELKVAYVGAFEPWHGVPILVRAVARVVAQGLDLHLLLIGSGSEENRIKELVGTTGLEKRVTFTGQLCNVKLAEFLRDAEIGVSPYCGRDEYSGLKLLDYKAAGLATIASGKGGEPRAIEHGRSGWIVSPCDEMELSKAITLLASNGDLRKRLGQLARIEAEKIHSWQNTALQLSELFDNLVIA